MSAQWSLTYLKSDISERELFDVMVDAFRSELDGRLYDLGERVNGRYTIVKLGEMIVEWFDNPKRARMTHDSHFNTYSRGVMLYPKRGELFAFADTVIHTGSMPDAARSRRQELSQRLAEKPDPYEEVMFFYINFLNTITKQLDTEAAHVIFERQPAGHVTSVHLHSRGNLIDDFYVEFIVDEYGIIELLQHPELVKQHLDGRFAFLTDLPKYDKYEDDDYEFPVYFYGEDLPSPNIKSNDLFGLEDSDLYVPFWHQDMLPLGAVYALTKDLPDYFTKEYETP